MSIEQTDVVDAVGVEASSGKVILTISDHLDWAREEEHQLALQEKINAYLRFIESGELSRKYPEAANKPVVISVVLRVPPSPDGEAFLEQVMSLLNDAGIEFRAKAFVDNDEATNYELTRADELE